MAKLEHNELRDLIGQGQGSITQGACYTCECFLGYLAQLRIDSVPADQELFLPFKVERNEMHHCIGCNPCPPGDLYTQYMKKKQNPGLIQL